MRIVEKTGVAEVLLPDDKTATGSYHLVIEPNAALAKGVLRLDEGQSAHTAMAARNVRIRFDRRVDLPVSVHLFVPGAGLIAFTCLEASVLVRA